MYDPILDEREKDWSFIPKFIREDAIKTANNEKIKAENEQKQETTNEETTTEESVEEVEVEVVPDEEKK